MKRDKIPPGAVEQALFQIGEMLRRRIAQKGDGAYVGPHESHGIIDEEFEELGDAMRANDEIEFYKELVDVAVACVLAMASSDTWELNPKNGYVEGVDR